MILGRFERGAIALAFGLVAGCVDTSPGVYVPPDGGAADVIDEARATACGHCINDDGAPCRSQQDTCNANPQCTLITACFTETDCWKSPLTDLNNLAPCLTDCGSRAGVNSQFDPAAILAGGVLGCAQSNCKSACVGDDGD